MEQDGALGVDEVGLDVGDVEQLLEVLHVGAGLVHVFADLEDRPGAARIVLLQTQAAIGRPSPGRAGHAKEIALAAAGIGVDGARLEKGEREERRQPLRMGHCRLGASEAG